MELNHMNQCDLCNGTAVINLVDNQLCSKHLKMVANEMEKRAIGGIANRIQGARNKIDIKELLTSQPVLVSAVGLENPGE